MKKKGDFLERKIAAMSAKAEKWQDRVSEAVVILLMCVQPLYLNAARYIRLTWHKYVFFAVCVCCVLLAVLIIWVYRLSRKPRLAPRGRLFVADWAILAFAAVTLLSALFSPFKGETNVWSGLPERYDGAITQLMYVAIFFIISRWYKPRERDFVFFGISAILIALIGVFQFYGMDFFKLWPNHLPERYVENFYQIPFRSTLGNIDIVSTYVCIAVLLCGFLYVRGTSSKGRFVFLAGSALCFWLMDLADANSGRIGLLAAAVLSLPFIIENRRTLGRFFVLGSSWLAVLTLQMLFFDVLSIGARSAGSLLPYAVAALVLFAAGIILSASRSNPSPHAASLPTRPRWKLGVILICVCIVGGIVGIEVLGRRDAESAPPESKVSIFVYETREMLHGNIRDEFATNRGYIWRNALGVFPKNPIIGSGPDTFFSAFPDEAQYAYGEPYDKAHNEYLQILICQGILGLIFYLVFLCGVIYRPVPAAFKNPIPMAVLAAFVGYCVQAFFNISLPIASQILWILAGMMCAMQGMGKRESIQALG